MKGFLQRITVVCRRYHDNIHRYLPSSYLAQGFKSVGQRHKHIKDDQINRIAFNKIKRAFAVPALFHDPEIPVSIYILFVYHCDHRVIFHN